MEHAPIVEEPDAQARAFSFSYLRSQGNKESFNISPPDTAADWALKNELQGFLVFRFYEDMILFFDIMSRHFS